MIELFIALGFLVVSIPLGVFLLGRYIDWRYRKWLDRRISF